MENSNSNKNKLTTQFQFFQIGQEYKKPTNQINVSRGIITWGKDNNYPKFLFDIYNHYGSTLHTSIINKKNKLITGRGFQDIKNKDLQEFVLRTKLKEQIKRAELDSLITDGMAFEIIWSKDQTSISSIKHIPIHKLRKAVETEDHPYPHFEFSNDWERIRKNENRPEIIREWNPNLKVGKQIYVHYEYNPDMYIYPICPYENSLLYIQLDHEISKYHYNQAKNGFSATNMISFADGTPNSDEMEKFNDRFDELYKGTSGKTMLYTYSDDKESIPTVQPIAGNDSDRRFLLLMSEIEKQIVRGSEMPPQLAILTPGKLGSTEERMNLLKEFQFTYITPRQETLEDILNDILSYNNYGELLEIRQYENVLQENKDKNDNDL